MDGICTVCKNILQDISKDKCGDCESKIFEDTPIEEKGDWIETNSGIPFYPLSPRLEKIDICDIAHSLSQLCRFNGHCMSFYSVAQHSILCSLEARERGFSKKIQLRALLHDAQEAYISDIPRPVKACLPGIKQVEDNLQEMIYRKFGLYWNDAEANEIVREIDNDLLSFEAYKFMESKGKAWTTYNPTKLQLPYEEIFEVLSISTAMVLAKKRFLDLFCDLYVRYITPEKKRYII